MNDHPAAISEFEVLRELVARRRAVRRFRTDHVGDETLDDIFQLLDLAPSVGNSQPWRWVRVEDKTLRVKVQENFESSNRLARRAVEAEKQELYDSLKLAGLKEAPVQFAVFCDRDTMQGAGLGRQTMPETLHYSVVCAIMTFWLGAKARGLGVGWVSILDPKTITEMLGVPNQWDLIAYLCVGYPLEDHYDPELERFGWQKRMRSHDHMLSR